MTGDPAMFVAARLAQLTPIDVMDVRPTNKQQ